MRAILIVFLLLCILIINLGSFLDVTQEPVKSDIIICLGGGDVERIKKSIALYENGYSKYNVLILTGDNRTREEKKDKKLDRRFIFLKGIDTIYQPYASSTKKEILFIKRYMLKNNFNSAIIVSNPSHSRRIKALINILNVEDDDKLTFTIVGAEASNWTTQEYYKSKKGQVTVAYEWVKLFSSYIAYGIFEKLGIFESVKVYVEPIYIKIRKNINIMIYCYQKEK